ncbi:coiled-coil domain-containing protein 187 isoform X5 [Lampris incognitus]|uniref:coiled-coil domain-containing protein 187 isoform X5 n=1 Tax=Lampris incognitus TaxID=2546036 RepID=UPI0024B54B9E|nr:coiled-coil domain-containing protein 187 isoform X5 [Lampris incognitus]
MSASSHSVVPCGSVVCAGGNSRETATIGQTCGEVAVIGRACPVVQNARSLAEFVLIVAIATSRNPGGADGCEENTARGDVSCLCERFVSMCVMHDSFSFTSEGESSPPAFRSCPTPVYSSAAGSAAAAAVCVLTALVCHPVSELSPLSSTLLQLSSREEQDSEYARNIQEELQRCAEEARRREQEDEEIAKRIQEEEEWRVKRRSRGQESLSDGRTCQPQSRRACLDLGDLHQVLEDEELARRLQEEEDQLLRREIARFMQKQEIKSKRRSRELEGPASWREHREMMEHHRAGRHTTERRVQRERLDSEGLPSPIEDYSAENQPPSPVSTLPQTQQIRNVAEELDPTFKVKRQDKESLREGLTGPACQSLPVGQSGLRDLLEEPAFIPPTKRQSDKSGRSKPKEKKENCKQQ